MATGSADMHVAPLRIVARATRGSSARICAWGDVQTPLCVLQTHGGQPFHMLRDVLATLPLSATCLVGIRYPHVLSHSHAHERVIEQSLAHRDTLAVSAATSAGDTGVKRHDLADYVGLHPRLTFLTLRDPSRLLLVQSNDKSATLQTHEGRCVVTPSEFARTCRAIRPDLAVPLHDDLIIGAGNNRTRACVTRTVSWFKEFMAELHGPGRESALRVAVSLPLNAVSAGNTPARTAAIDALLRHADDFNDSVVAVVFNGLYLGEPAADRQALLADVIATQLQPRREHLLRILPCNGGALDMLRCIRAGVDVLDCDYAVQLTTAGMAACFHYDRASGATAPQGDGFKLNLRDAGFARDFTPLQPGCSCAACGGTLALDVLDLDVSAALPLRPCVRTEQRGYTRAYVYHLLNAHEMCASVLLQVHNVHHIAAFLQHVRTEIAADTFDEYCAWFAAANGCDAV